MPPEMEILSGGVNFILEVKEDINGYTWKLNLGRGP